MEVSCTTRRASVYALHFFISLAYFLVLYINTSYLARYTDATGVSFLVIAGSLLSLLIFAHFSQLITRFGDFVITIVVIMLLALSLALLAFSPSATVALGAFVLFIALSPVQFLNLDIFLERMTTNESETGSIRGFFMTMKDIAQIGGPLLVAFLLSFASYAVVYLVATLTLVIALILLISTLRTFKDAPYAPEHLLASIKDILANKGLRAAWISQLILYFFYGWMVVYVPYYLHNIVHFAWETLGIMLAIMLVPFLLLQYPLGRLSDFIGEKWILAFGFLIMSASVALLPSITTPSFMYATLILFCSRVGAAAVEIASEAHFFRLTESTRAERMSILRAVHPGMYIIASLTGALALLFVPLQLAFYILAFVTLLGIPYSLSLSQITQRDT